MIGHLTTTLQNLLTESLPDLLVGENAPVTLTIRTEQTQFSGDPTIQNTTASTPRVEDYTDRLPFQGNESSEPYRLTQVPYPGRQQVWLITEEGDLISLQTSEIIWDTTDSRNFRLSLNPDRDIASITHVEVLYGISVIETTLNAVQHVNLIFQPPQTDQPDVTQTENRLQGAEALAIAVLTLNRPYLLAQTPVPYASGNYRATVQIQNIQLVQSTTNPNAHQHVITLKADLIMKATRILGEEQSLPIKHILLSGVLVNFHSGLGQDSYQIR